MKYTPGTKGEAFYTRGIFNVQFVRIVLLLFPPVVSVAITGDCLSVLAVVSRQANRCTDDQSSRCLERERLQSPVYWQ